MALPNSISNSAKKLASVANSVANTSSAPVPPNTLGVKVSDQSVVNSGAGILTPAEKDYQKNGGIFGIITKPVENAVDQAVDIGKEIIKDIKESDVAKEITNNVSGLFNGSSGSGSSSTIAPAQPVDYMNADIAKHYGMSAETAYMEALSNTAHQREVADLIKAGINPALMYSSSGADAVSNATVGDETTGTETGSLTGKSILKMAATIGAVLFSKNKLRTAVTAATLIDKVFK